MNNLSPQGPLAIGALASRTGMSVSAIRYYEEVGLIPPATRRPSGHRVYKAQVQSVLTLIRNCRNFGFSVDETRSLVSLSSSQERDCVEARDIAHTHLTAVRAKLAELVNLERSLASFVQTCNNQCAGGPAPQCNILQDLSLKDAKPAVASASGCCA
jgi:DNA-binding transcriptional MerR regulator